LNCSAIGLQPQTGRVAFPIHRAGLVRNDAKFRFGRGPLASVDDTRWSLLL